MYFIYIYIYIYFPLSFSFCIFHEFNKKIGNIIYLGFLFPILKQKKKKWSSTFQNESINFIFSTYNINGKEKKDWIIYRTFSSYTQNHKTMRERAKA